MTGPEAGAEAGAGKLGVDACRFRAPTGWDVLPMKPPDRLIVVEPEGLEGFRANLVLTVMDNGGISFRDWQAGTDELLPQQLQSYQLLDLERIELGGHPGGRRLAQHVVSGPTPVTMEQWFALVGGRGYTLTGTVDSFRYDEVADVFTSAVASLHFETTR